jgi:peptide/nickel transport system permease protein
MAVISAVIVLLLYLVAAFCEFVAPYDPEETFAKYKMTPPTGIHIFDEAGNFQRPFVYKIQRDRDPETLRSIYTEDKSTIYPIRFWVEGSEYKLWGLWPMNIHLFGLDVRAR